MAEADHKHITTLLPTNSHLLRHIKAQVLLNRRVLACRGTLDRAIMQKQILYSTNGTPNLEFLYRCLIDIAAGMDYLHSLGVINGDLKPANVLLKSTNEDVRGFTCKVCTFPIDFYRLSLPGSADFNAIEDLIHYCDMCASGATAMSIHVVSRDERR